MVWEGGHFTCWCFQHKFLSRHCADQLLQVQRGRLTLLQQEQQPVSHSLWHGKGSQAEDPLGQTPLVLPSTQRDLTAHPKTSDSRSPQAGPSTHRCSPLPAQSQQPLA